MYRYHVKTLVITVLLSLTAQANNANSLNWKAELLREVPLRSSTNIFALSEPTKPTSIYKSDPGSVDQMFHIDAPAAFGFLDGAAELDQKLYFYWQGSRYLDPTSNTDWKYSTGIVRINRDGIADSTYGNHGFVDIPYTSDSPYNFIRAAYINSDGSVQFVGARIIPASGSTPTTQQLIEGKLLANGELDSSYGGIGYVALPITNNRSVHIEVKKLPDNSTMSIGFHFTENSDGTRSNYISFITRRNADGSLNAMFAGDGVLEVPDVRFHSLRILPNGKYLVLDYGLANAPEVTHVRRFNEDGSVDGSFGTNGMFTIDGTQSYDIEVMHDNTLLVAGGSKTGDLYIHRLLADGEGFDTSFGNEGRILREQQGVAWDAIELPSGNLLFAVDNLFNAPSDSDLEVSALRLTHSGLNDLAFGPHGKITIEKGAYFSINAVLQSDNKAVFPMTCGFSSFPKQANVVMGCLKRVNSVDGESKPESANSGGSTSIAYLLICVLMAVARRSLKIS